MQKNRSPTLDIGSHINAPGERRPTEKTPGTAPKACAVGRPLHWVVRPGSSSARPDPIFPLWTCAPRSDCVCHRRAGALAVWRG